MAYAHVMAVVAIWYGCSWHVLLSTLVISQSCLLGVTAGAHRLWSHGSFRASTPIRLFLAITQAVASQGSARWWAQRHRIHHRWVDTEFDPYNSKRGFFYSHIGWILERPKYNPKVRLIDLRDIDADWVVRWQRTAYPYIVIFAGFIFPWILGWAHGDPLMGFLWFGPVARVISWHGIFFVNSYCHWKGARLFDNEISARTNGFLGLWSMGESNHSAHHVFAKDYRHGIMPYDIDPAKWAIWVWAQLGLVDRLYKFDDHIIQQCALETSIEQKRQQLHALEQQHAQHMESAKGTSYFMPPVHTLPVWSMQKLQEKAEAEKGGALVVVDGIVHDVRKYLPSHPGGVALLREWHGRDATEAFYRGLNIHSKAARILMARMAVARLLEDEETESSEKEG
eukprot:Cvel_21149.t1-p1 / transcript=Cvel_21149.t1 / gene=Cvel_21149 / organism=Chromera_velia_CCMP2878 / gene_product=Acyl-CoA desaturase 1, putative / transcript_product=Acyl-CoA desaturase 1, putative / location=Cvel_scaffold1961:2711-3895(-) / protein_length=395 / sequence_SO=supercontig / SO=protein_coding / is_pseudo=false